MRGLVGLLGIALLLTGCAKKAPPAGDLPPENVTFIKPLVRDVAEMVEFTGWTRAAKTVELRARVTGYLLNGRDGQPAFTEGADVAEGTELFHIDPRTYLAEMERAEANIRQAQATYDRLTADLERATSAGLATSREERERLRGNLLETRAAIQAARAAHKSAELNVGFTVVKAPFSGRLSRRYIDPGNLVKADDTILTTIVSLDPVHAYFDVDERTVLRLRGLVHEKAIVSARETPLEVQIALTGQQEFLRTGTIDFIDNQLDVGTGTLRVRAVIPNPTPPGLKSPMLSPGMFVRVRMQVGSPKPSLLVPEKTLLSDQGKYFLFVIEDTTNKAIQREVKVGTAQMHPLPGTPAKLEVYRVVTEEAPGANPLNAQSRVVVDGIQKVSDKTKVTPTELVDEPPQRTDNPK